VARVTADVGSGGTAEDAEELEVGDGKSKPCPCLLRIMLNS